MPRNVVIKANPQDPGAWLSALYKYPSPNAVGVSPGLLRAVRDALRMGLWWGHAPDLAGLVFEVAFNNLGMGPGISSRSQRREGEAPDIVLTAKCEGIPHGRVRIGRKTWSFPQFRDLADAKVEVL